MLITILFLVLCGASLIRPANATASAAPQVNSRSPAAPGTTCELYLEGYATRPGIKLAKLSCKGAGIRAAAQPELRKALGTSVGVVWSDSSDCSQDMAERKCLMSICSQSSASFVKPVVKNILAPDATGDQLRSLVCVSGGSNVVLQDGVFAANRAQPIRLTGNTTRGLITNCTFEDNKQLDPNMAGGAVGVRGAKATIVSSRFNGNQAAVGGAVLADGNAVVTIGSADAIEAAASTFVNNSATHTAGHIHLDQDAKAHVLGARLRGGRVASGGGIISMYGDSHAILEDASLDNAASTRGGAGCILTIEDTHLTIIRSSISNCSSPGAQGGAIDATDQSVVKIIDSRIINNTAGTKGLANAIGGGINLSARAQLTLQDTVIQGNSAHLGGGLAVIDNATLVLQGNNSIVDNRAVKSGGGIVLTSSRFVPSSLLTASVHDNSAPFGADISLPLRKIEVLGSNSSLDAFIPSIDSQGGLLYVALRVLGAGGLPSDDPITVSLLNGVRNVSLFTQTVQGKRINLIRDIALRIRQAPGDYLLQFEAPNSQVDGNPVTPAVLPLRIIPCPKGYATASTGDACIPCGQMRGYFSFDPADRECSMCVPNAECPGLGDIQGGSALWPVRGFWHSAPQSIQMHGCLNPSACVGGEALAIATNLSVSEYKTAQCSEPYQGNLCGDCKDGYGKARPFLCRKCMSKAAIVALYVLGILGMTGLIKLLVLLSQALSGTARTCWKTPLPVELLKIAVLHCQWLYIFSNLVGIPWPATLVYPMQVIVGIWSSASGSSIGFECVLPHNSRVPLAIQKVLISLLTPVAILCLVLLLEAVWHCFRPRVAAGVRHQLASLVMTVVFMFMPVWVSTALSLFTCVQLDRAARWPFQAEAVAISGFWAEDMNQQCYSPAGYHKGWALGLGIPLAVLLCLFLPAGMFMFMWYSRKLGKLSHTLFDRHYGFMYRLWREEVCWWEAVVVLQTIGLVMVATFGFALGPYYQALVTSAVLVLIVVLLLWVRPFRCPASNTIAVQSASVLFLTVYAALTFLPYNSLESGPVYGGIMGVMLLLLNLVFLAVTAWKLVRLVDWSVPQQLLLRVLGKGCGVKGFKLQP